MVRPELTEAEFQALCGFLHAAVQHLGLAAVKDAAALVAKLEAAYEASKATLEDEPKP